MAVPIEIDVWQGEIGELEVDAIIVPANESLFMTGAVSAGLKRRGGEQIEQAAVAQGPVPVGSAVVTVGGALAALFVIHAVAVGHDLRADPDRLRSALRAALALTDELQLRRVALAPLGTDHGAFSPRDAATLMLDELTGEAAQVRGHPAEVVLVATRPAELSAFRAALDAMRARAG